MKPESLNRILITGAGGMIGSQIPFGIKLGRADLDVCNHSQVTQTLDKSKPSGVIHLASLDLRQCLQDPQQAGRTNIDATAHLAGECRRLGIPLVFFSSGAVFNGPRGRVFLEEDRPDPLNVYAQTKVGAENAIREAAGEHLIIRTGWVFGGHGAHHPKFVDVAWALAQAGEVIQASDDQTGSPTFVSDLIEAMRLALLEGSTGTLHLVNSGPASAFDLAGELIRLTNSKSPLEKTSSQEFSKAKRSASEALGSTRATLRSWQEALKDYITRL